MSSFYLRQYTAYSWRDLEGDRKLLLKSPTFVVDCDDGNRYTFSLREGLVWDGASVPKIFRWYLPNVDSTNLVYTAAGLLHDFCYGSECLPKDKADDLFRGIMRDAGVPRRKAGVADFCVRRFGASHYGKDKDSYGIRFFGECDIHSR